MGDSKNALPFGLFCHLEKHQIRLNFVQAFFPEKNWVSFHENNLNHSLFRIRHNKKNLKSYFQLSLFLARS